MGGRAAGAAARRAVERRLEEIEQEIADLNAEMSAMAAAISQGEPGIRGWLRFSLILFGAAMILALASLVATILALPALVTGPGAAVAGRIALGALLIAFLKTLTKGSPATMLTTLTGLQTQALQLREDLERRKEALEREKPR